MIISQKYKEITSRKDSQKYTRYNNSNKRQHHTD